MYDLQDENGTFALTSPFNLRQPDVTVSLLCLGVSHHETPLHARERLSYAPDQLAHALQFTISARHDPAWRLREVAILSTCNRTELYATVTDGAEGDPWSSSRAVFRETLGVEPDLYQPYEVRRENLDAVRHLARVASGLDSMVLGESEILGQVAEAIRLSADAGASRSVLRDVFRTAVRAGKRARTETGIGRHPASVGSVWVHLAGEMMDQPSERHAVVVGAGRMARKAVVVLRSRGIGQLTIANRTIETASELAGEDGVSIPLERLGAALETADIVVCATSAAQPVLSTEMLDRTPRPDGAEPLVVVDIGIPRNVDPSLRTRQDVRLIDMDDIQRCLESSVDNRKAEIPAVESIIEEETLRYATDHVDSEILPVLSAIRQGAEASRQREVDRFLARRPSLSPELQDEIDALSRSLVNNVLEHPSRRLRTEAGNGHAETYARIAKDLFGVPD